MRVVGKWEGRQEAALNVEIRISYYEDGTVKARTRSPGITVGGSGTYKFLDDHTIVQELAFKGDSESTVKGSYQLSFGEDGMTQTDEHGNSVNYRKVGSGDADRSSTFWADVKRGWDSTKWVDDYAWSFLVWALAVCILVELGRGIHRAFRAHSARRAALEKEPKIAARKDTSGRESN
jgi:hypothetical protein